MSMCSCRFTSSLNFLAAGRYRVRTGLVPPMTTTQKSKRERLLLIEVYPLQLLCGIALGTQDALPFVRIGEDHFPFWPRTQCQFLCNAVLPNLPDETMPVRLQDITEGRKGIEYMCGLIAN